MKQEMTELVCIIDKSGSMSGFESDTIGSFNGMIEKQKKLPGTCYLTVVLFNQTMDMVYDRENISHVPPMTEKDYVAGGCTAMLDAVGLSIRRMEKLLSHKPKDARPDHVVSSLPPTAVKTQAPASAGMISTGSSAKERKWAGPSSSPAPTLT